MTGGEEFSSTAASGVVGFHRQEEDVHRVQKVESVRPDDRRADENRSVLVFDAQARVPNGSELFRPRFDQRDVVSRGEHPGADLAPDGAGAEDR